MKNTSTTQLPLFSDETDPLRPGLADPTPPHKIAALSPDERQERVKYLVKQSQQIYADTLALAGPKTIKGSVLLFSGGNDSTVLGHLFKDTATHAMHANTGIGIEETRQFVRDTCKAWDLPLLEKHPPAGDTYRELVLDQGFPGPGHHYKMYQRLKERCMDQVRRDLVKNGRRECVVFIAGRRRAESARRKDIPLSERKKTILWASPLAMWTKLDLATYRTMHDDVPENRVSGLINMSGECLCGAFAHRGELDELGHHFPKIRAEIEALEQEVRAAGHQEPFCTWGHGKGKPSGKTGPMCTACTLTDPLWELIEKGK